VLATRPDVLILDEPTFGQDARTWAELVTLLDELLREGRSVVAVTHDRAFVEALADTEVVLEAAFDSGSFIGARAVAVAR
jgi:energy-coupling factor transport system ATP-binding protein